MQKKIKDYSRDLNLAKLVQNEKIEAIFREQLYLRNSGSFCREFMTELAASIEKASAIAASCLRFARLSEKAGIGQEEISRTKEVILAKAKDIKRQVEELDPEKFPKMGVPIALLDLIYLLKSSRQVGRQDLK